MLYRLAFLFVVPVCAALALDTEDTPLNNPGLDCLTEEATFFEEPCSYEAGLLEVPPVEAPTMYEATCTFDDPAALAAKLRELGLADGEAPDEEALCDFFIMIWDHLDEIKARFPRISDILRFLQENVELSAQMGFSLDDDALELLDTLIQFLEERERLYEEGKASIQS